MGHSKYIVVKYEDNDDDDDEQQEEDSLFRRECAGAVSATFVRIMFGS